MRLVNKYKIFVIKGEIMNWENILTGIIIPLIAGFIGGSIGNIVIQSHRTKKNNKMNNKNAHFSNNGDVVNGNKR